MIGMTGMTVSVYTNDDMVFVYRVTAVHRHQVSLAGAIATRAEELWLQTSEGPRGTVDKLEVVATPIRRGWASPRDAYPVAVPTVCGP
jgi:hypothetical protein